MKNPPKVLSIGGSDSSGGAGIQADLKAVQACGCYGMSVITAVTAQNSLGVQGVFPVSSAFIRQQLISVISDIRVDAVKTGMIWNSGAVRVISDVVGRYKVQKLVIDPVMVAKGGSVLMKEDTRKALVKELFPLALVVTPNIPEAESLSGMKIKKIAHMRKAAEIIFNMGAKNVLVKGGHLHGEEKKISMDILYDGKKYQEFSAEWIHTKNTHGTGCTFASLLAAGIAQGRNISDAAQFAKIMVTKAINNSISLGKGHGTLNVGIEYYSLKGKNECLLELQKAVNYLMYRKLGKLIPEVSSNLVYAKKDARNEKQVAGFPGRIIRVLDEAHVVTNPQFGASGHMAHVVLTVMKHDTSYRSAMNIKYAEKTVDICKKVGFTVKSFDRKDEPIEKKDKEGFSLEWGVNKVLEQSKIIPDIIYDKGGWGKEPMIRVLGKNPLDVANKIERLFKHL